MAKKMMTLTILDIIMGADAETIKAAYDSKMKIDEQLALREEAYRQIAEIEDRIEQICGVQGQFVFPAPPLPIAGITRPADCIKMPLNRIQRTQDDVSRAVEPMDEAIDGDDHDESTPWSDDAEAREADSVRHGQGSSKKQK